jgi:hypothetical protein
MEPMGPGMGATQLACRVGSFTRAAGLLEMSTVGAPIMIIPGPAGMQPGSMQGMVCPPITAAGRFPMSTVGAPGGINMRGNPGCGMGVGTGAGGWMGA